MSVRISAKPISPTCSARNKPQTQSAAAFWFSTFLVEQYVPESEARSIVFELCHGKIQSQNVMLVATSDGDGDKPCRVLPTQSRNTLNTYYEQIVP